MLGGHTTVQRPSAPGARPAPVRLARGAAARSPQAFAAAAAPAPGPQPGGLAGRLGQRRPVWVAYREDRRDAAPPRRSGAATPDADLAAVLAGAVQIIDERMAALRAAPSPERALQLALEVLDPVDHCYTAFADRFASKTKATAVYEARLVAAAADAIAAALWPQLESVLRGKRAMHACFAAAHRLPAWLQLPGERNDRSNEPFRSVVATAQRYYSGYGQIDAAEVRGAFPRDEAHVFAFRFGHHHLAQLVEAELQHRCAAWGMQRGRDFVFCADGHCHGNHSKAPDARHCVVLMFSRRGWNFDRLLAAMDGLAAAC
ncbi:hypothetical protein Rsub_11596 [Raphidocelis subcapitata]|uniref:Uncharacterized protein n=1 Tax=Raphidocelis subcapitata TaxID=307507 RepID=A0A2V0PG85_9CHLO|nr:hypothetical protein Rsub_11596 [Raphidocelis subcapitata]|eukprot:GBF98831.1 hypothetical protein Rsub_11596 [Raphidocelis subcapitata]